MEQLCPNLFLDVVIYLAGWPGDHWVARIFEHAPTPWCGATGMHPITWMFCWLCLWTTIWLPEWVVNVDTFCAYFWYILILQWFLIGSVSSLFSRIFRMSYNKALLLAQGRGSSYGLLVNAYLIFNLFAGCPSNRWFFQASSWWFPRW